MTKTVALLVGSLRQQSLNRKLAKALETLAEGRLTFTELNIGALPHYNDELWDNPPASVLELKETLKQADGVLVVTPEYNRTYPGVIKNALDWGTRPWGDNSWSGKPAAVTGTSPGAIGAAMAQGHLKNDLLHVGTIVMSQPEAYIQWKDDAYAEDGSVTDEKTAEFLKGFVSALADWIEKHG
ncbi:NADPH-dependent FMN reductase [Paracoccus yeei]|uniref:NAD(P)H-dependent oxidoreductase n=1 Tax=Paracoccus yeei TaxID=147645 RepID=A0A5P2QUG7_9RHOB|nr:NAD(P)H-dependent oxidoreductase [Paracoccus yeei]QEU09036.1 NAD(P)H-dependent oxidoreductase [Paracoccus yeei]